MNICLVPNHDIQEGYLRDSFGRDFVSLMGNRLNHVIVAVLMSNEKSSFDITPVWINSFFCEYPLVMVVIIQVDCSIECKQDHLRRLESETII